jgi:hypothetical protein
LALGFAGVLFLRASARADIVAPDYHSDLGAPATLYIDFTGNTNNAWGLYTPGTTPAYDIDGDPTTFSQTELSNIQQIWSGVAEKYSPFNIDVTTQAPANMSPGSTMEVVVGGDGQWFADATGTLAGGTSYVGSFRNGPNIAYVFPDNLARSNHGFPRYVMDAVAHEAGHGFGLVHQSAYVFDSSTGTYDFSAEYSFGTYNFNPALTTAQQTVQPGSRSPIMGESYFGERALWWNGPTDAGYNVTQDDMSIIASGANGFGYRPEPSNTSFAAAQPMTIAGAGNFTAQGIIIHPTDRDYFSVTSSGGEASFEVDVAPFGAMLDASLQLYSSDGTLIAQSITGSLSETLSADLAPGTYDVVVSSAGNYGDVGQYTLTAIPAPEPAGLSIVLLLMSCFRRKRG